MKWTWLGCDGEGVKHVMMAALFAVAAVADVSLPLRRRQSVFDSLRHAGRTVDDHAQRVVELPEIRVRDHLGQIFPWDKTANPQVETAL